MDRQHDLGRMLMAANVASLMLASQAVARQIALHGCAQVKVDGPYGGYSPLLKGQCEVAVIFAGGIGVMPSPAV